jgi:hypothetical protein
VLKDKSTDVSEGFFSYVTLLKNLKKLLDIFIVGRPHSFTAFTVSQSKFLCELPAFLPVHGPGGCIVFKSVMNKGPAPVRFVSGSVQADKKTLSFFEPRSNITQPVFKLL